MKDSLAPVASSAGLAFLFPGQGAQYFQMGAALFHGDERFRTLMLQLDQALIAEGGTSVVERLYDPATGRDQPCEDLCFTHPALFMVELALAQRLEAGGTVPDLCLGVSLGEFAQAAFAGVLPPEEMLRCIARTARIVDALCPAGRMLAVMAPLAVRDGLEDVEFVGEQAEDHFLLSGSAEAIESAARRLRAQGVLCVSPPVARAFHSSAMDAATREIAAVFAGRSYRAPRLGLISAMTGEVVRAPGAQHFSTLGRGQIRLSAAVSTLKAQGRVHRLIDVGPSGSLASVTLRALPDWPRDRILSPFAAGQAEIERLRALDEGTMRDIGTEGMPQARSGGLRAVVFAGQGAQVAGMGAALFARYPEMVAEADRILGYSIAEICRDNPEGKLGNTRFTQPLVFCVNALAWRDHLERQGMPALLAGHSLGEMNALQAAGVMEFETALTIVQRRAELMAAAPAGAMTAVLGLEREALQRVLSEAGLARVDIANLNTPSQIVISGDAEEVKRAAPLIQAAGARACIPLPVSGAFHSRLMQRAEAEFSEFLSGFRFAAPRVPVISNVTARPYLAQDIGGQIARLLSRSVNWLGSVAHMLDAGVTEFVELAPKPILTAMIAEIRRSHVVTPPAPPTPAPPPPEPAAPPVVRALGVERAAETLGSAAFRAAHGTRYAHICGGMVHGIASTDWVVACAKAGILAFFGTGGLAPARVEAAILDLNARLGPGDPFGFNLLSGSNEAANVDLFLRHGIRRIEASAFIKMTQDLVRYRLAGLVRDALAPGGVAITHRIIAKLSRPEVARAFLSPPPDALVQALLARGQVTSEMAELARRIPMADDICVEADSGGHTDQGNAAVLIPAICRLRDALQAEHRYAEPPRVGAGGGIGTPEAAASALMLGAEFTLTGSINQCTIEAGTSALVKEMLAQAEVPDTAYAPAGDMFEIGARVQVLRRGVLFPARANRLFELYMRHGALEEIDPQTREQIETRYFQRSFEEVWQDCLAYWPPAAIERAQAVPKQKMAYVFRWYFGLTGRLALQGLAERKVDFQIHCGPAMGAFNQWIAETDLAPWQSRGVAAVNTRLLTGTARRITQAIEDFSRR